MSSAVDDRRAVDEQRILTVLFPEMKELS